MTALGMSVMMERNNYEKKKEFEVELNIRCQYRLAVIASQEIIDN